MTSDYSSEACMIEDVGMCVYIDQTKVCVTDQKIVRSS